MSLLDEFRRVSRSLPCPVCERPDWCLVSRDNPPSNVICHRVESPRRFGDAGWLHKLRDDGWRPTRSMRTVRTVASPPCSNGFENIVAEYQRALDRDSLAFFADSLGVSQASLRRLRIGWDGRAWSFPMVDPQRGEGVCGVRLRKPEGRKCSVRGGHEGLFVPQGLTNDGPLLLPEGPTDTAAALDLGFDAVGRPSCTGGTRLVVALVRQMKPPEVVVIADSDEPGQRGAANLARALATYCRGVRVVTPPGKDLRDWFRAGALTQDLQDLIDSSAPLTLRFGVKGVRS